MYGNSGIGTNANYYNVEWRLINIWALWGISRDMLGMLPYIWADIGIGITEKKLEATLYDLELREILEYFTPIMESEVEKNMENEMDATTYTDYVQGI